MKINRENYEAWFLDYHEGVLSPSEAADVLVFLEQNPELNTVFREFEAIQLEPDTTFTFSGKEALKKNEIRACGPVNEGNYEEYLIAELEGLLDADGTSHLAEFLKANPTIENERKLFSLTTLPVDDAVVFDRKSALYHKAISTESIHEDNFDIFLVNQVEGLLDEASAAELDEFLALNPHLRRDQKLIGLTRLTPDATIIYPDKASLQRKGVIPLRRIAYYTLSAAASIILLLGIYFTVENRKPVSQVATISSLNPTSDPTPNPVLKNNTSNLQLIEAPSGVKTSTAPVQYAAANILPTKNREIQDMERDASQVAFLEAREGREIISRNLVDPEFLFIRTSQMQINDNLGLYYNVKLAEQVQYASLYLKDNVTGKNLLASLYTRTTRLVSGKKSETPVSSEPELSLWTLAQLGVKTFSTVTKRDVELEVVRDEEGNRVYYDLTSPSFDISRTIKK